MQEKKSDFFSSKRMPTEVIGKLSHYLHPSPLVKMQLVSHPVRKVAQQAITLGAKAMPAIIPEQERRNVWCIYECLRNFDIFEKFRNSEDGNYRINMTEIPPLPTAPVGKIDPWASIRPKEVVRELTSAESQFLFGAGIFSAQIPLPRIADIHASIRLKSNLNELTDEEIVVLQQSNLLPQDFRIPYQADLPFPLLPEALIDPWAALRPKRCMYNLTLLEIHELFTKGLLDQYLLLLGKNDCEKASLIMESSFLSARLPFRERTRTPSPSLFSRVCLFLFAIVSSLFSFIFLICTSIFFAIGLILLLCLPIARCYCKLFGPNLSWGQIISIGLGGIFKSIVCAILAVIYPIYCVFVSVYIGCKFGPAGMSLIKELALTRLQAYYYTNDILPPFKALFALPKPSPRTNPDMVIADLALYAERIEQQNNIRKLRFGVAAISVPESRRREPVANKSKTFIEMKEMKPLLAAEVIEDDASYQQ